MDIQKIKRNTNKLDESFGLPQVCLNYCTFSRGASVLSNGLSSVDKEEKSNVFCIIVLLLPNQTAGFM